MAGRSYPGCVQDFANKQSRQLPTSSSWDGTAGNHYSCSCDLCHLPGFAFCVEEKSQRGKASPWPNSPSHHWESDATKPQGCPCISLQGKGFIRGWSSPGKGGVIFRLSSCHLQAFLVLLTTKTLGVSVSVLEDRYLFFFFLDWITLEQVVRCVNLTWDIDWILVNGKILKSEHTLTERLPVPSACNTYQKASQANVITVLLYYYYYFILICGILYDPPSKEWSPHLALTQPSSAMLTDNIHSFGNILWEKVLSQWVHCASIYSPEQP